MELSPLLLCLLLISSSYSYKVIEGKQNGFLPQFTWLDSTNILVSFSNGVQDTIKLWTAEKIGNITVPCLFEGVIKDDNSSTLAVSGCQNDDVVNIVIYSSHMPNHTMFNIYNGTVEEVEKIDFTKRNKNGVERKKKQRLTKRGAYVVDDDDDYDYIGFDAKDPQEPPPLLSLNVKLAFEESLLIEKGTETAVRQYIARVFILGRQHLLHTSLGTNIGLRAQGPIKRIEGKSWNPSIADLKESRKEKEQEKVPITFFCYNEDRENDVGIAYMRQACSEEKGVAIVAARGDINKAAQSYGHEVGHWLGLPHDDDISPEYCEGEGIMSSIFTPGGRPSKWSHCSKKRFNRWFYKDDRKYSKCIKDEGEELILESSNGVATQLYSSGSKYVGDLKDGMRTGKGICKYHNGDKYNGEWKDDKRHGKGIYTYSDGDKYDGEWKHNKMHGKGIYTWLNGGKYNGEWKDGNMFGKGILTYSDGTKYDGQWKDDKRHGKGIRTYLDGDKYDGEWKDNKIHGKGIYTWLTDGKYNGEWKDGNMFGKGIRTYSDGTKYDGQWKDDKKHGKGIRTYSDGSKYDGQWKDDKRHGKGIRTYLDGDKYDGEWKDDMKHGKGIYIFSNGDKYSGDWKDNKMHGRGKYVWASGIEYDGQWRNDNQYP